MTQLKYTVNCVDGVNNFVIVLPVGLTIKNRKLHRNCLDYKIKGGYVFDSENVSKVHLGTASDNWAVRSALKRGRNTWLKMHKELLENNPQLKPKWHDYKIALLTAQQDYWGEKPGSAPTYQYIPEDIWEVNFPHEDKGITWSIYTTEHNDLSGGANYNTDKDEFNAHLIGGTVKQGAGNSNIISLGLVESWIDSRPDLEPITTVSDAELDKIQEDPLNMLFNDGDADNEIIENFHNAVDGNGAQEGDVYPAYHLKTPVATIEERAVAFTSPSNPVAYFKGFNALMGQVFVSINCSKAADVDIMFDVDPRGVTI